MLLVENPIGWIRSSLIAGFLLTHSAVAFSSTHTGHILASSEHFIIDAQTIPRGQEGSYSAQAAFLANFSEAQIFTKLSPTTQLRWGQSRITIRFSNEGLLPAEFLKPDYKDLQEENARGLILIQQKYLMDSNTIQLIAHEFFHAVHYQAHSSEVSFIREGLAQLFEWRVLGRLNSQNVTAALKNLDTRLTGEYPLDSISPAQYGHALLYFYYLYQQCGADEIFWNIVEKHPSLNGIANLDAALSDMKRSEIECENFESSRIHFEIARVLNHYRPGARDPKQAFLMNTSLKAQMTDRANFEEISLRRSGGSAGSASLSDDFIRYCIHEIWPFEVSSNCQDVSDTKWLILLIRKYPQSSSL